VVTLANSQVIEYPISENSMTEETRKMITDKIDLQLTPTSTAMMKLIDDICRPAHSPKPVRDDYLIRTLKVMKTDFDLSGNEIYAETCLRCIEELGGEL
jgi:hypothetical protein